MQRMTRIALLTIALNAIVFQNMAQAGPLLDWLKDRFGRLGRRNQPVVSAYSPVVAYSPPVVDSHIVGYPPAGSQIAYSPAYEQQGVIANQPGTAIVQSSCMQTCQRVTVSYVPETRHRSLWVQTPVTSYRPTTTSDP